MHSKALKEIKGSYGIVSRFEGGMSNFTYLVQDQNNNKYVYRYPGKNNDNFVNYKNLEKHLDEIKNLDITNELVYYNSDTGIKISKYIEGEMATSKVDLQLVVNVLKKIHNSNVSFFDYDHLGRLEKYEKLANNKSDKYYELKQKWLDIYDNLLKEHIKYSTHGDSQLSNIVVTPSRVYLLDWEFSGINDYIYDIAAFGNQDFSMAIKLLEAYEGEIEDDKLKRLYGWRIFQCLQWYNVALYKEHIGLSNDLNIDFLAVSKKYLTLVESLLSEYSKI